MDSECALYLSTIQVPLHDSKDDFDRLAKNWNHLPNKLKESNLVLDLLNVLSGLESSFFTWSLNRFTGGYDVVINPLLDKDFDEEFFEMCSDILDIRLYQNELLEFVNLNQKSFICQSLSEDIFNVLEDLQQCVSKFHDRHLQSFLGVEKLFNYLKPARQTLSLLSNVVNGYNTSSLLYDKTNIGVLILDHLEHTWRNEVGLKKELLQHLLNVCLESYFTLIKNYIAYSSVNRSVLDFFIKYKDKDYLLENYTRTSDTSRLSNNDNNRENKKIMYNHDYEDNYIYGNHQDLYLETLFNDNNDMKLILDKRYVPRAFNKLSVQVFVTGLYLKLMNKNLEFELMFRNLDDLVSDLDKVYNHVSYQFYEYLKNDCKIFDKFKDFFNYYLFQESDYILDVIEKFNQNLDLNQINRYFENNINNKNNFRNNKDNNNTKNDHFYSKSNKDKDNNNRLYFCFDNMKNLTDSLEYYKYYKNVKNQDNNDMNIDYNYYNNRDISNGTDNNKYNNNNGKLNEKNKNKNKVDKDNTNKRIESKDNDDTNSADSFEVDMMNDHYIYDNHQDHYLETLFNDNNLDYRNLVLCFELDKASKFVFTDKIVYKYKLLFKLLFQLKYTEYLLNQVSLYHVKTSKMAIDPELVPKFNLQLFTVSRMQLFVKDVLQYFLVDVVSTNVSEFLSSDYDDFLSLYTNHERLVDRLVNLTFLRHSELVSVLEKILLLIVKFSTELIRFLNSMDCNLYYDDFLNLVNPSFVFNSLSHEEHDYCVNSDSVTPVCPDQTSAVDLKQMNEIHGSNGNKDNLNNHNNFDMLDDTPNLDRLKKLEEMRILENMEKLKKFDMLERDTDNLNSLLINTGYCKMVSLARSEFEKNLNQFKSVLSKTEFSLKDKLL